VVYTDVFVEGDAYTISGGMHNTHSADHGTTARVNQPQKYFFKFYRAGETLYGDRFGSRVISLDFAEFKFYSPVNGGTQRAMWRREGATAAPKGDLADEIAKLHKLKEQGVLSEAEFAAAKKNCFINRIRSQYIVLIMCTDANFLLTCYLLC
jgi:hypothetical protein